MKNNPLKVIVILLLAVSVYLLADIRSDLQNYVDSKDVVETTTIEEKLTNLKKLSNSVQITFFEELLGKPVIINYPYDTEYTEYVFRDELYFVQAITTSRDKVVSYAVTSRSDDFNPEIEIVGSKISLNETTYGNFPDVLENPMYCSKYLGNTASSYFYFGYYVGNPGKYQTFLFGLNDSAPHDDYPQTSAIGLDTEDCSEIDMSTTENVSPNTYAVISSHVQFDNDILFSGVDKDDVRLLNE